MRHAHVKPLLAAHYRGTDFFKQNISKPNYNTDTLALYIPKV